MATCVYIDGFNLYYQIRAKGFKWLDLKTLAEEVLPCPPDIKSIKYFTARVSGAWDAGAPGRQQVYLNALRTIPEVEIHFGEFLAKPAWRPILNLPVGGHDILCSPQAQVSRGMHRVPAENQTLEVWNYPPNGPKTKRPHKRKPQPDAVRAEVFRMEEKGSDVNLGAHLLNDGWKRVYDSALVITNDTDLVTPIRMVTQELGLSVTVATAHKYGCSPKLKCVATHTRHIHDAMLKRSQFPPVIHDQRTITKPTSW